jgi:thioredoxin 1
MSEKNDVKTDAGTDGSSSAGATSGCGCGSGTCGRKSKAWIGLLLIGVVGAILFTKNGGKCPAGGTCVLPPAAPAAMPAPVVGTNTATAEVVVPLPRLVDLGAGKCIPCKMMAPILEDLKKTYAGKLDVQFIDVWENPDAGNAYGINVIPTQIFYTQDGKEVFRHEGFFSKEDILAKWKELGVTFVESETVPSSGLGRTREAE